MPTLTPSLSYDRLREISVEAASVAAGHVRTSSDHRPVATKSTGTDIVTATDLAAETLIRDVLERATPGADVLGEEGGHRSGAGPHGDIEWIVDPLDGTVNFAYGIPISAVSVAAVVGGRPVAGAVVDVARDETYHAHLGGGARVGVTPLAAGSCDELRLALVGTGFAYDAERRQAHGRTIAELLGRVRDVRAFGSAALHLCWVASGRLDVYLERDTKPWDYAAATVIAREAGGVVELPCPENDGLVLGANPVLFEAIRPLLVST